MFSFYVSLLEPLTVQVFIFPKIISDKPFTFDVTYKNM